MKFSHRFLPKEPGSARSHRTSESAARRELSSHKESKKDSPSGLEFQPFEDENSAIQRLNSCYIENGRHGIPWLAAWRPRPLL
jgi:hypothetical protein